MSNPPICPSCSSSRLKVIGAFFLSHEGTALDASTSLEGLAAGGYSLTRQILQCDDCYKRCTLEEAERSAGLASKAVYWESNDKGLMRPIVCPKCGNNAEFTRDVLTLVKSTQTVSTDMGVLSITESSDAEQQDLVVLAYHCAQQGCTGTLTIRSKPYGLVAQKD